MWITLGGMVYLRFLNHVAEFGELGSTNREAQNKNVRDETYSRGKASRLEPVWSMTIGRDYQ